ncbi:MAG: YitT family protein [Acholeplasmataceae bacterium]
MKKDRILEISLIVFGIVLMNLGFYFFYLPMGLVTGGVTGLSVIFVKFHIAAWITILLLNVAFLLIGLLFLGKQFFIKTLFGSLFSPLVIFILQTLKISETLIIDHLSETPLLVSAILGSLFVGFGLGIVFRNGGSTGGMDIAQVILHKKYHRNYTFSFIVTDGLIVLLGFIAFQNIEKFFFSIASVILISIIIDQYSIKGRAGSTLFIVTNYPIEVKEAIFKTVDRGVTMIDAKGGYSDEDKTLVICVVNKRELNLIRHVIEETDNEAFTFIAQTKEAVGRGFSRD